MKTLSVIKRFSFAILVGLTACVSTGLFGMQLQLKYPIQNIPLDAQAIQQIESSIGYQFKNKKFLIKALTSRAKNPDANYEQYEYVGDKILDMVLAQMLFHQYPNATEGDISTARDALVSQEPMAALCVRLGLHKYVQDFKNEIPISCLCDIIESTVAALYEDGGFESARIFILKFFLPMTNREKCPKMMHFIIRTAAEETNKNICYRHDDTSFKLVESSPGTGEISSIPPLPKIGDKNNPKRLAKYLAERKYIKEQLDNKYQAYLARWATDHDYKPLDKIPALTLSFIENLSDNFRVRLCSLMGILGLGTPHYSDVDESDDNFICTVTNNLVGLITTGQGSKKSIAQEAAAKIAYQELQLSVISTDLIGKSNDIAALNTNDPIASLNLFCQKHGLQLPTYSAYFKEKNGKSAIYHRIDAPWLLTGIKGPAKPIESEAKKAAAGRVIALMQRASTGCIEPKKVQALSLVKNTFRGTEEPTGCLNTICRYAGLSDPQIETHICEGPTTDGPRFETMITLDNKKHKQKKITGQKASSKSESQADAAKKALNYMANKMIKAEISS